jgi:hypothetical protein
MYWLVLLIPAGFAMLLVIAGWLEQRLDSSESDLARRETRHAAPLRSRREASHRTSRTEKLTKSSE